MGALHTIKNIIAPATVEQLRAALAKAEAAHRAAVDAWTEDEGAGRWRVVEDAEREAKQLRARLGRAETLETRARDEAAAKARDALRAQLTAAVARVEDRTFVDRTVRGVVEHAGALANDYAEIIAHANARANDLRTIEDLSRQLGESVPLRAHEVPLDVVGITTMIRRAVRDATAARGGSVAVETGVSDMLAGTTR